MHTTNGAALVVDDQADVRQVLGAMLARLGYTPVLAGGGVEAVAALRADRADVAGALLDVQMPGMDGPATLAALHALDPNLPCVFLSGNTGRYSAADLLGCGAVAVLGKPVPLDLLNDTLAAAVAPGPA